MSLYQAQWIAVLFLKSRLILHYEEAEVICQKTLLCGYFEARSPWGEISIPENLGGTGGEGSLHLQILQSQMLTGSCDHFCPLQLAYPASPDSHRPKL